MWSLFADFCAYGSIFVGCLISSILFYDFLSNRTKFVFMETNKRAFLVTGAGSGLGRKTVMVMVDHILDKEMNKFEDIRTLYLFLLDINREGLSTIQLELEQKMLGMTKFKLVVLPYTCDLKQPEKVRETITAIKQKCTNLNTHLSLLINNAGIVSGKSILDLSEQDFTDTYNVNLRAHIEFTRAFLPDMIASTETCQIVSICSLMSFLSAAKLSDYGSSKAAAFSFLECVHMELMRRGHAQRINTMAVCPYMINTGMFKGAFKLDPATHTFYRTQLSRFIWWVFPELDTEEVAKEVVKGMVNKESFVVVPRAMRLAPFLIRLLPTRVYYSIQGFSGGTHGMDDFKGHLKAS